jgi:sigma-B regulation protein RsbU (phosphoserine phosphatase)
MNKQPDHDPGLRQVVFGDLRHTRFPRDFLQDIKDLYYFYLDENTRSRLAGMGRVKRAFWLLGWLLKSMLMKLSPVRRILLLLSFILVFLLGDTSFGWRNWAISADLRPWAWLLMLLILMLELKDKLVAKDEIQIARQVQIALLPHENPLIPGWSVWCYSRPANDVGGDLVDYIELDGFRHGVVLGDVAGKGLGAALLSAKLQATLRALVPDAVALDDLATRVNSIFLRDGLDNRYATLFYAEIEYNSGMLRYLNAGHNPAFLIRAEGIEKLGASSFPLGMMPDTDYKEFGLQLEPGEMLLVYSDGLTEAQNPRGEEFGLGRLEKLLPEFRNMPPEKIGARILKEADHFLEDRRAGDDLSLIVIVRQ